MKKRTYLGKSSIHSTVAVAAAAASTFIAPAQANASLCSAAIRSVAVVVVVVVVFKHSTDKDGQRELFLTLVVSQTHHLRLQRCCP